MKKSLFIFRRDLRLEDNTGLLFALKNSDHVIPCFIFTPEQIDHNPYLSLHCLQFMIESLEDLEAALAKKGGRLFLFQGKVDEVVEKCIKTLAIEAVVVNRDYTPYSLKRDKSIQSVCDHHGIAFHSFEDALLHPIEEGLKADGTQYKVFTPYFKHVGRFDVEEPKTHRFDHYYKGSIDWAKKHSFFEEILPKRANLMPGGRTAGLKILHKLTLFTEYATLRDIPAVDGTTHLSPHLKFTTCSIREVYHSIRNALGPGSTLLRSLYWRDFFTAIGFYFPHVFKGAFRPEFDQVEWSYDRSGFHRWCKGETGFPIVDAGIREMNQTGYMHNRVRMITGSFLVKDLHMDWRWGEKYFAQTLIDYDPAINNGNWQWVASTGCDAQPYFRIFNPWTQQAKFDPDCEYIKRWVPELASLPSHLIHHWHLPKNRGEKTSYPEPMLDHAKEAKRAIAAYRKIS